MLAFIQPYLEKVLLMFVIFDVVVDVVDVVLDGFGAVVVSAP